MRGRERERQRSPLAMEKKKFLKHGAAGHRSRYLSHAKRALYHLSYSPNLLVEEVQNRYFNHIFTHCQKRKVHLFSNRCLPFFLPSFLRSSHECVCTINEMETSKRSRKRRKAQGEDAKRETTTSGKKASTPPPQKKKKKKKKKPRTTAMRSC